MIAICSRKPPGELPGAVEPGLQKQFGANVVNLGYVGQRGVHVAPLNSATNQNLPANPTENSVEPPRSPSQMANFRCKSAETRTLSVRWRGIPTSAQHPLALTKRQTSDVLLPRTASFTRATFQPRIDGKLQLRVVAHDGQRGRKQGMRALNFRHSHTLLVRSGKRYGTGTTAIYPPTTIPAA